MEKTKKGSRENDGEKKKIEQKMKGKRNKKRNREGKICKNEEKCRQASG